METPGRQSAKSSAECRRLYKTAWNQSAVVIATSTCSAIAKKANHIRSLDRRADPAIISIRCDRPVSTACWQQVFDQFEISLSLWPSTSGCCGGAQQVLHGGLLQEGRSSLSKRVMRRLGKFISGSIRRSHWQSSASAA
jgi:hypothetical protein